MKKAVLLGLLLSFALFAACAPEEEETPAAHTHTYGEWTVAEEATLFEDGLRERECTAADCDAADKGRETEVIPAIGKTSAVIDAFTNYNSALEETENGVKMGLEKDESDGSSWGASTFLGAADKVTEFDGTNATTISFDLDLSALAEGEFTIFSLAFGNKGENEDGSAMFVYVTENIFGVIKTDAGYTVAQINNVNYTAADKDLILSSANKEEITDSDNVITFSYRYQYDGALSSELLVNNQSAITFTINGAEGKTMEGAGYLWNCNASNGNVVFSRLIKA